MRHALILATALLTAGCVTQAVVSDLETDKVKVQATGNDMAVIMAEARRGCAMHDRVPRQVSFVCRDNYCINKEYLFACVDGESEILPASNLDDLSTP